MCEDGREASIASARYRPPSLAEVAPRRRCDSFSATEPAHSQVFFFETKNGTRGDDPVPFLFDGKVWRNNPARLRLFQFAGVLLRRGVRDVNPISIKKGGESQRRKEKNFGLLRPMNPRNAQIGFMFRCDSAGFHTRQFNAISSNVNLFGFFFA